jgi:hypothetical protein
LLYLPSFTESCSFLNPADRVLATARGKDGENQESSLVSTSIRIETKRPLYKFSKIQMIDVLSEAKSWLFMVVFFLLSTSLVLLLKLAPELIVTSFQIGHDTLNNPKNLLRVIEENDNSTVPIMLLNIVPYGVGMIVSLITAKSADGWKNRYKIAYFSLLMSSLSFAYLAIVSPIYDGAGAARYFAGLLPGITGLIVALPLVLVIGLEQSIDDTHRATACWLIIGLGSWLNVLLARMDYWTSMPPSFPNAWIFLTIMSLIGSIILVIQSRKSSDNGWGSGLRRLMNDQEESKAWDTVEMKSMMKNAQIDDDELWK